MKTAQWKLPVRLIQFLILHCTFLIISACGNDNAGQPQMPNVPVNVVLTLSNQQYAALRTVNGTVVLPAGNSGLPDAGGVKGIIVVRQAGNSYLAFERNCPYRPYDACALVSVDRSGLFLRDSCCSSQFNFQGQVTGGPSPVPLRQYSTSVQGTQLNILN